MSRCQLFPSDEVESDGNSHSLGPVLFPLLRVHLRLRQQVMDGTP